MALKSANFEEVTVVLPLNTSCVDIINLDKVTLIEKEKQSFILSFCK